MSLPYRPAPPAEAPCAHTQKCCGQCHAAVGGCLQGVTFTVRGREVRAGVTMDRLEGTPAQRWCTAHGRWEGTGE